MEHQFFKDRLSAYFDMELKNEEHAIVHEHVEGCDECQQKIRELEKFEQLIAENTDLSENDYWEQSAQKIESAISGNKNTEIITVQTKSSSGLWWKLTGVAASLVLVAIFAFDQKDAPDELLMESPQSYSIEHDRDDSTSSSQETELRDAFTDEEAVVESEEINNIESDVAKQIEQIKDDQVDQLTKEKELTLGKDINANDQPVPVQPKIKTKKRIEPQSLKKNDQLSIDKLSSDTDKETITPSIASKKKSRVASGSVSKDELQSVTTLRENVDSKDSKLTESLSEKVQIDNFVAKPQTAPQKTAGESSQISYWRRKIDLYTTQLADTPKNKVRYSLNAPKDTNKNETDSEHIDKDLTYKQLFEAYYHVAVMTNDSLEERESVLFLTTYADSLTKSYSSNAMHYLQLYKNEKSKQNSSKRSKD